MRVRIGVEQKNIDLVFLVHNSRPSVIQLHLERPVAAAALTLTNVSARINTIIEAKLMALFLLILLSSSVEHPPF